ncbi:hypothetical protein K438DRAFT_1837454 [Mycena galopus ATCC 62051]|nr:hypothetical protein K438DRAFT_1837454 [Mycena galopus ATCC 62051]
MSHSSTEASCLAILIHKAPSQMAPQEFEAAVQSFMTAILALPVVRNYLHKCEMLSSNSRFDEYIKMFGMPASAPQPTIVLSFESATSGQMLEIFNDGEVKKQLSQLAEELSASSSPFSVDVLEKHSKPGVSRSNTLRVLGLFPMTQPPTPGPKLEALVDSIVAHPTIQETLLGYTIWRPNDVLGDLATKPPFLILLEAQSWDAMVEIAKDKGVQEIIAHGHEDFGFHAESSSFSVDIVTKFARE